MNNIQIKETVEGLELVKTKKSAFKKLMPEVAFIIFWYAVLFSYSSAFRAEKAIFAYLFFFAPFILIPRWFKLTKPFVTKESILFDLNTRAVYNGKTALTSFDQIDKVVIKYKLQLDNDRSLLNLVLKNGKHFLIEEMDAHWNKELQLVGNKIADFIGVKFHDLHPYEEK